MSRIQWPEGTTFRRITLVPEDRACRACGRFMHESDRMARYLRTFGDPVHVVTVACRCPDKGCPGRTERRVSEDLIALAPPHWSISWDLFAWMGHRRYQRHWSCEQISGDLWDRFRMRVSDDVVEDYTEQYELMVAARESDIERMREAYRDTPDVVLTIDGLQPEKGHETLYVVRELNLGRLWFAEPLLSSSQGEINGLFERALEISRRLDKPVRAWMSDKQAAFVAGVEAVFPGVPHRLCQNHFLRDAAKPVLEEDSHAKVQMRRKVRGLRDIERPVLARSRRAKEAASTQVAAAAAAPAAAKSPQAATPAEQPPNSPTEAPLPTQPAGSATNAPAPIETADDVVLAYCAAVRGVLNDDQGGPLHPPGVRMAAALEEIFDSIGRARMEKKGGPVTGPSPSSPPASHLASPRSPRR